MSFRVFLEPYRVALTRIFQTTLDYHGNPANPWGLRPGVRRRGCEYSAGCAIGLSLQPETARMADEARYGPILILLDSGSSEAESVLRDLFDTPRVPRPVGIILALLQRYHDDLALNNEGKYPVSNELRRKLYLKKVTRLARFARLSVRSSGPTAPSCAATLLHDTSEFQRTTLRALVEVETGEEGVAVRIFDETKTIQLGHVALELYNCELNVQFWNEKQLGEGNAGTVECLSYFDSAEFEEVTVA